jgi:hypothetical protein
VSEVREVSLALGSEARELRAEAGVRTGLRALGSGMIWGRGGGGGAVSSVLFLPRKRREPGKCIRLMLLVGGGELTYSCS